MVSLQTPPLPPPPQPTRSLNHLLLPRARTIELSIYKQNRFKFSFRVVFPLLGLTHLGGQLPPPPPPTHTHTTLSARCCTTRITKLLLAWPWFELLFGYVLVVLSYSFSSVASAYTIRKEKTGHFEHIRYNLEYHAQQQSSGNKMLYGLLHETFSTFCSLEN